MSISENSPLLNNQSQYEKETMEIRKKQKSIRIKIFLVGIPLLITSAALYFTGHKTEGSCSFVASIVTFVGGAIWIRSEDYHQKPPPLNSWKNPFNPTSLMNPNNPMSPFNLNSPINR